VTDYGLFGSLFAFDFKEEHFEAIKQGVGILKTSPIDDESGEALIEMMDILESRTFNEMRHESDLVFFSPATSLIPMTASYYDEQRDDGKKRMDMLNYVLKSKYRKNTASFKENEDHIEFISLYMQKLIEEEMQGEEGADSLGKELFEKILNPMIDQLSEKLFTHEKSVLYKEAAIVLSTFAEFERLFLNVARPVLSMDKNAAPAIRPRKIKKAPRKLVERNIDEFVSI
jgi:TorA maturation chaperone TorD